MTQHVSVLTEARRLPRAAAAPVALALAVTAAAVAWALAGRRSPTPWITPDETLYALLGRNLFEHGRLGVLGEPVPFYSLVHPFVVGLGLLGGYGAAKALAALVMAAAAVPVYLWGRRLMRPGWALVAAALTLASPALVYTGTLMTEVTFYPVVVLAAWAAWRALEHPDRGRQALLVAALGLALATRLQAVALLPAVVAAAVATRRTRALWPAWAALGALAAGWAVARAVSGGGLLGGYTAATESGYRVGPAVEYVLVHLGALVWTTGVVPALALVLLAVTRRREPRLSAFVAVAGAVALAFVVEVGVFASVHVEAVAERDLLGVAPLLFLALCAWLDRGAPRPRVAASVAALLVTAAVALLPTRFVDAEAIYDAPSLAALAQLDVDPAAVLVPVAAALAAAAVLLPRRALVLLPAVLALGLAAAGASASGLMAGRSEALRDGLLGPEPAWVDAAADGPAAYLYDGEGNWNAVWEHVFWNERIDAVLRLPGTRVEGALPQTTVLPGASGRLAGGGTPRYVVAPSVVELRGEPVAEAEQPAAAHRALVLWRLEGPPTMLARVTGVQRNGDVFAHARVTAYDCREGTFVSTVIAKEELELEVRLDDRVVERRSMRAGETAGIEASVPASAESRICTFDLVPSGLLGTTKLAFLR